MTQRSKPGSTDRPSSRVVGRSEGELESIPDAQWQRLQQRAAILRTFGDGPMTQAQAERASQQLGVYWTTAYRWRKRLLDGELVTALQDRARGFPARQGRLSPEQEEVVGQVVRSRLGHASGNLHRSGEAGRVTFVHVPRFGGWLAGVRNLQARQRLLQSAVRRLMEQGLVNLG